jgi:hypothetical protein
MDGHRPDEQPGADVGVVERAAVDGLQRPLGRQQAHPHRERFVHKARHRLQPITGLRPPRVRLGLRDRRGPLAEGGRVVELAVEVLVRLDRPLRRNVTSHRRRDRPAEPAVAPDQTLHIRGHR